MKDLIKLTIVGLLLINTTYGFTQPDPEMMAYIGNSLENYNSYKSVFDILYSENSLIFKSGEKFEYGNHGYTLMAKIIENVTGMSINEFASKKIFKPLGMKNTFYNENTRITVKNKAIAYDKSLSGDYQKHYINTPCVGSGNIITTLDDLLLWEKNFHNNTIFPKGYIDLVTQKGVLNNGDTLSYAFGIGHGDYKGHKTISHSGSVNCYESKILRIPDEKLSVVISSNVYYIKALLDNHDLAEKVASLYLSNSQNTREVKIRKTNFNNYPTSQVSTDFSGTYKSDKGITWIFKKDNKYRIVHSFNDWFDSMLPINDSLCVDEYATDDFYKFKLDSKGNVVSLKCPYTGLALKTANVFSNDALSKYQGFFYSEELNSMFKFYQVDKKLYCRVNNNPPVGIFYISDSKLKLENLLIEPIETKDRIISKLKLSGDMGGNIIVGRLNK